MISSRLNIAFFFIALILSDGIAAQTGPGSARGAGRHGSQGGTPLIVTRATVDTTRIVIGQPFHLLVEATAPETGSVVWPAIDSLAHFEVLEKGKVDSFTRSGAHYYRQYLTVTSFDSGSYAIPMLHFLSGGKNYYSDSVPMQIGYSKFDPSKDYHDIKDIIEVPNPFARWIPWIIAAVTLLAIGLVIWLVRKKKAQRQLVAGEAPRLSPYEEAMRQLAEIEKKGMAADGAVKLFYSRLNEILRMFMLRKLGISSLAETNEELIGEIRRLPLSAAQFDELAETLRMTDFVKFAKYQPGIADNERSFHVIRSSVELFNTIGESQETPDADRPAVRGKDNMPLPAKDAAPKAAAPARNNDAARNGDAGRNSDAARRTDTDR